MGSRCRSNQLGHPYPLNLPIEPDQARLKGVYTTSSRPLVNHKRLIIPTYTRALHDLNSTDWTSARSLQDFHPTRSGCDRILLESGWSGTVWVKDFNPTKLDCNTNASRATRSSTWPIHDPSRALLDRLATFQNIRIGSSSDADQGRPSRPIPITHTDRIRPVPDCFIGLDRVDLISSGNIA